MGLPVFSKRAARDSLSEGKLGKLYVSDVDIPYSTHEAPAYVTFDIEYLVSDTERKGIAPEAAEESAEKPPMHGSDGEELATKFASAAQAGLDGDAEQQEVANAVVHYLQTTGIRGMISEPQKADLKQVAMVVRQFFGPAATLKIKTHQYWGGDYRARRRRTIADPMLVDKIVEMGREDSINAVKMLFTSLPAQFQQVIFGADDVNLVYEKDASARHLSHPYDWRMAEARFKRAYQWLKSKRSGPPIMDPEKGINSEEDWYQYIDDMMAWYRHQVRQIRSSKELQEKETWRPVYVVVKLNIGDMSDRSSGLVGAVRGAYADALNVGGVEKVDNATVWHTGIQNLDAWFTTFDSAVGKLYDDAMIELWSAALGAKIVGISGEDIVFGASHYNDETDDSEVVAQPDNSTPEEPQELPESVDPISRIASQL